MEWRKVGRHIKWIVRNLVGVAVVGWLMFYVVEGVVRMIRKGGQVNVGGIIVVGVVCLFALLIVVPGAALLWWIGRDTVRVLLGKETEIED